MKPHRTDALSLTFGLIFLSAVVVWILDRTTTRPLPGLAWFAAAALIVAGVVGLLTGLRSDRSAGANVPDDEASASLDGTDQFTADPFAADPFAADSFAADAFTGSPVTRSEADPPASAG